METLLRAKQVAEIMNVRPSTVYDLARRGILCYVRIAQGKRRSMIRFRQSDLEEFIAEHLRARTVEQNQK